MERKTAWFDICAIAQLAEDVTSSPPEEHKKLKQEATGEFVSCGMCGICMM